MAGRRVKVGFRLQGHPWSGNVRKRKSRWPLYHHDLRWKNDARLMALDAANRGRWTIPERARVTVTFEFGVQRDRDEDNFTAACKGLLDGLKGVLIRDDNTEAIELRVELAVVGHKATKVEVEAL